jgi:hypothetical protein
MVYITSIHAQNMLVVVRLNRLMKVTGLLTKLHMTFMKALTRTSSRKLTSASMVDVPTRPSTTSVITKATRPITVLTAPLAKRVVAQVRT